MVDKLIMNPETYKQYFVDTKGNWDKAPEIHAEECRKASDKERKVLFKLTSGYTEYVDDEEEDGKEAKDECKMATLSEAVDVKSEKSKEDPELKASEHEVKFIIDDSYYKNLRPLGEGMTFDYLDCKFGPLEPGKIEPLLKEAVRTDYEYSFEGAFRWLLAGKTIKFVIDRRRFKIVDGEIVELLEFQGFSSKCMLRDRFYVEENEE
jgi:hypothetical protein